MVTIDYRLPAPMQLDFSDQPPFVLGRRPPSRPADRCAVTASPSQQFSKLLGKRLALGNLALAVLLEADRLDGDEAAGVHRGECRERVHRRVLLAVEVAGLAATAQDVRIALCKPLCVSKLFSPEYGGVRGALHIL